MTDINRLRKYFIYDDTLRTVVSVLSGVFIVIFNTFSGIIIVYVSTQLIFGNYSPDILKIILLIVLGIPAGACLMVLCTSFIDVLLTGTEVDNYTYVRLVLLASVSLYIMILIFYILFIVASMIETKFFEYL